MEKKRYVAPLVECVELTGGETLNGVSGNGAGVNATYGGVDTGGSKDPSANQRSSIWGANEDVRRSLW